MSGGIRNDGEGPAEVSVDEFTMNANDRLRYTIPVSIAQTFKAIELIATEHRKLICRYDMPDIRNINPEYTIIETCVFTTCLDVAVLLRVSGSPLM